MLPAIPRTPHLVSTLASRILPAARQAGRSGASSTRAHSNGRPPLRRQSTQLTGSVKNGHQATPTEPAWKAFPDDRTSPSSSHASSALEANVRSEVLKNVMAQGELNEHGSPFSSNFQGGNNLNNSLFVGNVYLDMLFPSNSEQVEADRRAIQEASKMGQDLHVFTLNPRLARQDIVTSGPSYLLAVNRGSFQDTRVVHGASLPHVSTFPFPPAITLHPWLRSGCLLSGMQSVFDILALPPHKAYDERTAQLVATFGWDEFVAMNVVGRRLHEQFSSTQD